MSDIAFHGKLPKAADPYFAVGRLWVDCPGCSRSQEWDLVHWEAKCKCNAIFPISFPDPAVAEQYAFGRRIP